MWIYIIFNKHNLSLNLRHFMSLSIKGVELENIRNRTKTGQIAGKHR